MLNVRYVETIDPDTQTPINWIGNYGKFGVVITIGTAYGEIAYKVEVSQHNSRDKVSALAPTFELAEKFASDRIRAAVYHKKSLAKSAVEWAGEFNKANADKSKAYAANSQKG